MKVIDRNRWSATALLFFSFSTTACGGGQKEAESAEEPAPTEEAPQEDVSDEEADLLAQIEASAEAADEAAAAADSKDDEREVVYRLSQDGLKVQIEGAEFRPKAEAVKVAGRWGVKLTVEATTTSEKFLMAPNSGPLAFGGQAMRGGSPSKFSDRREGDGELKLVPGETVKFSRTWPSTGQQGLAPGEQLELHVGLWGLGSDSTDKKPVRRFFVVKMAADQMGAQPLIQPPGQ